MLILSFREAGNIVNLALRRDGATREGLFTSAIGEVTSKGHSGLSRSLGELCIDYKRY